jgi:hypothetical protein
MTSSVRFKVNSPQIIQETIDGEVVIVNMDNGNYYSLDNVGAAIWSLIESGAAVSEVVDRMTQRYEGNHVDIENAVNQFVAELQQQALIVPDGAKEPGKGSKGLGMRVESGADIARLRFEVPILHIYTDMQDLLLLDPIHEVDETGWPNMRPDDF